jgi:hypothetical protein
MTTWATENPWLTFFLILFVTDMVTSAMRPKCKCEEVKE